MANDELIRWGDTVAAVKSAYGLKQEPTKYTAGGGYKYHLSDRGIWVFFDDDVEIVCGDLEEDIENISRETAC